MKEELFYIDFCDVNASVTHNSSLNQDWNKDYNIKTRKTVWKSVPKGSFAKIIHQIQRHVACFHISAFLFEKCTFGLSYLHCISSVKPLVIGVESTVDYHNGHNNEKLAKQVYKIEFSNRNIFIKLYG